MLHRKTAKRHFSHSLDCMYDPCMMQAACPKLVWYKEKGNIMEVIQSNKDTRPVVISIVKTNGINELHFSVQGYQQNRPTSCLAGRPCRRPVATHRIQSQCQCSTGKSWRKNNIAGRCGNWKPRPSEIIAGRSGSSKYASLGGFWNNSIGRKSREGVYKC